MDKKELIIGRILANDTYMPNSGTYAIAADALRKLSVRSLQSLELLLTMKTVESNKLAVDVSKILAK